MSEKQYTTLNLHQAVVAFAEGKTVEAFYSTSKTWRAIDEYRIFDLCGDKTRFRIESVSKEHCIQVAGFGIIGTEPNGGLSVRLHIAALLLQGCVQNYSESPDDFDREYWPKIVAGWTRAALTVADALIKEYNK